VPPKTVTSRLNWRKHFGALFGPLFEIRGHRLLTDFQCKTPPIDGKSDHFDGHGLYIDILKFGTQSWRWRYLIHGKKSG